MKKIIGCLITAAVALVSVFSIVGCADVEPTADSNAYSFVTIDINPSVELLALGGEVIEVKAANYDACVLLDGEDFTSLTVEDATAEIVALSEEMGYLTDENNQVKITVISDDAQTVEVLKAAAKSGAEKGSKKAVAVTEPRLQDELTVKKLKEEKPDKFANISEEKVRLIESIMEHDDEMTYEKGVEMSVNDLSVALKKSIDENRLIFTSELRSEYTLRYMEAKYEIEREIAAVYGEEYLCNWEKCVSVEKVYNSIEDMHNKAGLSNDDANTIMRLLDITDVSLIEKGGVVKSEYVLSYIDKHINKKSSANAQEIIQNVIEILDRVDAQKDFLSQEEIALVAEVLGDEANFKTVTELAAYVSDSKSELESLKREVNLTDEQISTIIDLKESFNSIKDRVLAGMSDLIASAQEEVSAEKLALRNA